MSRKANLINGAAMFAIVATCTSQAAFAAENKDLVSQSSAPDTVTSDSRGNSSTKRKKIKKSKALAKDNSPVVNGESGRLEGEVVVTGLRENVKSARGAKRRAQQIVDVVLAQDIGKLPDKNVAEALARVPGIQIDRDRGEGGKVLIRGLDGVMTTVNGSPTFSSSGRTTDLNDISSDLVAGIEVYKTRTPDQVEGSRTGVINLTLRRPTDFKPGATYAISSRFDYSDRIKKVNPYYSALIAYNQDTPIGRMGFSVNGTWNKVGYNEAVRFNELPSLLTSIRQPVLPTSTPARIYLPFRVGFAGTDGWSKRAAFQISSQWKPDDHWTLTVEGGYANRQALQADSTFWIPISYSESMNAPPSLSNVVLASDGRLVKSVSLYGLDPMGPGRTSYLETTKGYNGRFQVQYTDERIDFNAWANYQRSNRYSDSLYHSVRFSQQPRVDVIFNDPNDPLGGVKVDFKNIDTLDPKNYLYIDNFGQQRLDSRSAETELKADLKFNTFWNFIDNFKFGFRYNRRTYNYNYGGNWYASLRLPISQLSDYKLVQVGGQFQSSSNANWLIGDTNSIRASFPTIRRLLTPIYPKLAQTFPAYDPYNAFSGAEGGYAGYAQFHYNMKLFFPIEGIIGARLVNNITSLRSLRHVEAFVTNNDGLKTLVKTDTFFTPKGNTLDILPSVNAIMHFTSKLQLRASYTYEVGRPTANQINPVLSLNLQDPGNATGWGGNAQLRPVSLSKYDASLEWYFGSTGSASVAVWQWNQNGLIANDTVVEYMPDNPGIPIKITRPYNLGIGRHRGIEGQLTTFFTFLPGFLKSFGGSVNGTLNLTRQANPSKDENGNTVFVFGPMLYVSKYVYNLTGFFERGGLNIRVAYNWRSRRQLWLDGGNPYNNLFLDPVERLDAAINYDLTKNVTIGVEASNLTRSGDRSYWGTYDTPKDVKYFSRNFAFSLRARL
ncbi:TonB-dependent receptor [Sphingomonas sp. PB1R3]|uniref:TonB-dependent receptor n=1 Tax=Sphingomonas flavida TaxID=3096154 RepID=UPI002FCA24F5